MIIESKVRIFLFFMRFYMRYSLCANAGLTDTKGPFNFHAMMIYVIVNISEQMIEDERAVKLRMIFLSLLS